MNICIGGPWDGCKLLGRSRRRTFKITDDKNITTVYHKKIINMQGNIKVFWIADGMSNLHSEQNLQHYLRTLVSSKSKFNYL